MLYGFIYKPTDFDPSKKYPLLMYVYGGPESQEVLDEWNLRQAWFQLLAQHGYIVACVDNRGTDGRGEEFKKLTYLQLGKYETEDQVAAAKFLGSLPYIDKQRIGIFGWSYGGYMSLLCMMKAPDIFRTGIAVAPVTNWRFYDSAYTERFMRKPQQNAEGYDENSPLNHVDKLKGKLLLVHGSSDDNVHFQNSMMLVEELVQKDKQFEMQFYPNKNHGIFGGNTRFHLYTRMTGFIFNNL
jgi:dipeptidyl-peptidase-4